MNSNINCRKINLIACCLLLPFLTIAQTDINIQYARILTGSGSKEIKSIGTDDAGNIYVFGDFTGTVDFDPAAAVQNLTSAGSSDLFFAKYNSLGVYRFAKAIGGRNMEIASAMEVDGAGNIYLAGTFMDAPDFDPGVEAQNLVSLGGREIFFAKYSTTGTYIFANSIGGRADQNVTALKVDAAGNIFLTGNFSGSTDFNSGTDTTFIYGESQPACFIAKYNSSGGYVFAKCFRAGVRTIKKVLQDAAGNLVLTGEFIGPASFETSSTALRETSPVFDDVNADIFIAKYNSSGNLNMAKAITGNSLKFVKDMTLDMQGNILVTGFLTGTADFNPSERTQNLEAQGTDIFFAKYSPSIEYLFARRIGNAGFDKADAIATDQASNIYIAGNFSGTVDFDPDVNTANITAAGNSDGFIARYDASGNYIFSRNIGGAGDEIATLLKVDSRRNIHMAGSFLGSTDLAPCAADFINATSAGSSISDAFFTKFAQMDIPLTTITVTSNTTCAEEPIKLSIAPQHINPDIQWLWYSGSCNGNTVGSGNSISVKPGAGTTEYFVRGRSNCGLLGQCASLKYINDKPAAERTHISIDAPSPKEICAGTVITFTSKITGGGKTPAYKWFKNNRDVNVNTATYTDSTLNDGDSVFCILTTSNPCATPIKTKSNAIAFTVVNRGSPQLTLSSKDMLTQTEGSPIVINAAVTNAGSNRTLTYRWIINGDRAGGLVTKTPSYSGSFKNGYDITCELSSTLACLSRVLTVLPIQYKK
jgi:hypothetical protein